MSRDITDVKALPFDEDALIPDGEFNQLSPVLRAAILNISKKTFDAINGNGLAGTLEWSEKLPLIRSLGTSAPQRAQLIHRTTSGAIKKAVRVALREGYSVEQLAKGVPADGFPGLRSILTETEKRARLIARTEVMRTQNQTSVGFYKEQGFNFVRADDVDGDEHDTYVDPGDPYGFTCAERHNQVYSVEDAANIDDHPNGTLNWQPMPRDFSPEAVT
jgi:hypothetical protein